MKEFKIKPNSIFLQVYVYIFKDVINNMSEKILLKKLFEVIKYMIQKDQKYKDFFKNEIINKFYNKLNRIRAKYYSQLNEGEYHERSESEIEEFKKIYKYIKEFKITDKKLKKACFYVFKNMTNMTEETLTYKMQEFQNYYEDNYQHYIRTYIINKFTEKLNEIRKKYYSK